MVEEKGKQIENMTRMTRTLLFIDVVEYTRLLNNNERETISRWRKFVELIEISLLPGRKGRIVHSLGDGLLLDFATVLDGVAAVHDLREVTRLINEGYTEEQQFQFRMGMEVNDFEIDKHDVYGRGAMLGARLMTMAGPGECIISTSVRQELSPDLDVQIADLGDCYLKHLSHPVRAYRLGPRGRKPLIDPNLFTGRLIPAIAVVPFEARQTEPNYLILGDVFAEEIIKEISHSRDLDVISRLSTRVFRNTNWTPQQLRIQLAVDYILSGTYRVKGDRLFLDAELVETQSEFVVWAQRLEQPIANILAGEKEIISQIVADLIHSIASYEIQKSRTQALPNLQSYSLLMGGVNLMHSHSVEDFLLSREMLQTVADRATRLSTPRAWLAKWHVMRKHQGWSQDTEKDSQKAMEYCKAALDADPSSSLALAIDGLVRTHIQHDLDDGYKRYEAAVQSNPNDPMAWLLKGALHAFRGEGEIAVSNTQRALNLSPLDPHRYYFESLASTAFLSDRQYECALQYAQQSLRANPAHTSTLRAKLISEWNLGHERSAQRTAQQLLRLEPQFTVAAWKNSSPSADYNIGIEWAQALRSAGVPE